MTTYAVFGSKNQLKAINVTNLAASSIDYLVGNVNWYGINADNEADAIKKVKEKGYESKLLGN